MQQPPRQKAQVSFKEESHELRATIETERLHIRSYLDEDLEDCVILYGDEKLTKYFDHGNPWSRSDVEKIIPERAKQYFIKGEPLGIFSIFDKRDMSFIGQIDLFHSDEPGTVEIGCIFLRKSHNQGFPLESASVMINEYVQSINMKGFQFNGSLIIKVIATTHPKNYASKRLIESLGMTFDKLQDRFGHPRAWYSIAVGQPKIEEHHV